MFTNKEMRPFGLVWEGWRVYWGLEHGWLVGWPDWFKQPIVSVWAWLSCRFLGHEALGRLFIEDSDDEPEAYDPYCMHCSRLVLPLDGSFEGVKLGGTD